MKIETALHDVIDYLADDLAEYLSLIDRNAPTAQHHIGRSIERLIVTLCELAEETEITKE